jgi:small-conductance mechanosensitive channel
MSDLFSSLLIFTIIKTILRTFFFIVSNFYKNLVKWAFTEIESSVAGTTTLDRECQSICRCFIRVIVPYEISKVNFRVETKILQYVRRE